MTIVFVSFNGNPLHALGCLAVCLVLNVLFDALTATAGGYLAGGLLAGWLELAASALGLLVAALALVVAAKFLGQRGRAGLWQLVAGLVGGPAAVVAAAAAAGRGGRHQWQHQQHRQHQQQQQTAAQRQQRWDKVVRALQRLPTDTVATEQELEKLSTHELKERLACAGGDCSSTRYVEKQELVKALLEVGGSSAGSCCICCEDYTSGDVLRVLPCKHRFHLECVDRWFLSSTDYSRPPACPMCNQELAI